MNFYLKLFLFYVITLNNVEIRSCSGSELDEISQKQKTHAAHIEKKLEKKWKKLIKVRGDILKPPSGTTSWMIVGKQAETLKTIDECLLTVATDSKNPLHATKSWEALEILAQCHPSEVRYVSSSFIQNKKAVLEACFFIATNPNHPLYANITYGPIGAVWGFLKTHDLRNPEIKGEGKDALFFTLCAIIENPDHPLYKIHAGKIIKELWGPDFLGVRSDYDSRKLAKIGYRTLVQTSSPNDITEWNVVERLYGYAGWYDPISEDQKLLIPVLSAITTNTNHTLHKEYGSKTEKMMARINTFLSGSTGTSHILNNSAN